MQHEQAASDLLKQTDQWALYEQIVKLVEQKHGPADHFANLDHFLGLMHAFTSHVILMAQR